MAQSRAAVILAAGQGTRMRSTQSKVLHSVGGRSMLAWTIETARQAGVDAAVAVYGAHSPAVADRASELGAAVALQDPPLGTGHAVLAAREAIAALQPAPAITCVLYADTPLIQPETVASLCALVEARGGVAVLGFEPDDAGGYGRLILEPNGELARIVEAKDATPDELAVRLCNSGVLAAPTQMLFDLLAQVTNDNAKGEYYLTDIVALARAAGQPAHVQHADAREVLGVNDRVDLARAEAAFQERKRAQVLNAGVTLIDPASVYFAADTDIAADVVVEPHVVFGPGVTVERGSVIKSFSHLEGAHIGVDAQIGPHARLRPGAKIGEAAKVGNFVEIKKTRLGAGAKASHLTYLGDADIGEGANIGAGTITCNYDGRTKARTVIEPGVFIGSNAALVAPVRIGAGAFVAAGSVITDDVPPGALALARGRQTVKLDWPSQRTQTPSDPNPPTAPTPAKTNSEP